MISCSSLFSILEDKVFKYKSNLVAAFLLISTIPATSQEMTPFDADSFVDSLNERIVDDGIQGVLLRDAPILADGVDSLSRGWLEKLVTDPPEFGIVALDADMDPIDMFGAETPYSVVDGKISVPFYQLPAGGSFSIVGASGWRDTANVLATSYEPQAPSNDVQKALESVANATGYIADMLCNDPSRPTKLVLNITAGFSLAFNIETGSQVEWDLEVVCPRYVAASN